MTNMVFGSIEELRAYLANITPEQRKAKDDADRAAWEARLLQTPEQKAEEDAADMAWREHQILMRSMVRADIDYTLDTSKDPLSKKYY